LRAAGRSQVDFYVGLWRIFTNAVFDGGGAIGKTVSPSARSALALFNAAPTIWMSELSTLRSRMALAQEFSRRNEVKINGTGFDNNLFGSRAEVGAGVAVSLSERLQLHADFDYMKGKDVEQPWGANLGLRLAF
jgi:hypothetical protein